MNPAVLAGQTSIGVTFLASFLIWVMFGGLIVLWVIDGRVKKEQALHALLAVFVAWTASQIIKYFFPTVRPFNIDGSIPMTLTLHTDGAFPSSHAAVAFALATSIWLHDKKLGFVFGAMAALVGFGRILGNVHFLIDILAGAFIGIVSAFVIERLHLFKLVKK